MGFVTFLRCASGNYSSALVALVGDFPPRICNRPHFAGGTLARGAAQAGALFESERGYCSRADAFSISRSNRASVAEARRKADTGIQANPGAGSGSAKSRCHPAARGDAAAHTSCDTATEARRHAARNAAPSPCGHSASSVHAAPHPRAKSQTDTASQGGGDC